MTTLDPGEAAPRHRCWVASEVEPGLQILVVEDNRDAAVLTAALIEDAGHHTSIAYDGESGLALALEKIPDVILLDIGLPGLNGYQVGARILRRRSARHADSGSHRLRPAA